MTNQDRGMIGLSLEDLNTYTAHKAHQAEMAQDKTMKQDSPEEEKSEPLAEKLAELGSGDNF